VNNCAQVFVAQSWFGINGSAPAGSAAIHITGGFQQSYVGNYTYSALSSPSVKIDGSANGVSIEGGHVFDGTPTTVALGLADIAPGGVQLGRYQCNCGGGLTDTPTAIEPAPHALPGTTNLAGEEIVSRLFCTSVPALTSGLLVLAYFTAAKSEPISTIECQVNTSASGATYSGMGLYTVAANGDLTLVAKGEATSTLWTSAYQPVGGFNTKVPLTAVYSKIGGQRYAIGALFTGTTPPALVSAVASSGTPQSNYSVAGTPLGALSGQKSGQTTLGTVGVTTHSKASITGWAWMPYFVLA